jgi:hypothetical protein
MDLKPSWFMEEQIIGTLREREAGAKTRYLLHAFKRQGIAPNRKAASASLRLGWAGGFAIGGYLICRRVPTLRDEGDHRDRAGRRTGWVEVPRPTYSSICVIWGKRRTLALRHEREHRQRQP